MLPADGVLATCLATSAAGRIFMGGDDGHLYEVTYSAGDGGGVVKKVVDKLMGADRKRCEADCRQLDVPARAL